MIHVLPGTSLNGLIIKQLTDINKYVNTLFTCIQVNPVHTSTPDFPS